ncbi:lipocalin family protein [Parapedobacter pyrenivorans]|uniref:lipocalin family protein n=1 Tax=Parapedobacter pyrenivorans TaxID=1305674 RepID=UPI00333E2B26
MKPTPCALIALLILSLLFTACKKKELDHDVEDECEITVAALAGKYKIVAASYVEASGDRDVLHEIYDDCELDDINELKADKTFVYTDAGEKCKPDMSESGTWNVNANSRILMLNAGTSTILSFTCKELVVTYRDGADNIVKETYRKQ